MFVMNVLIYTMVTVRLVLMELKKRSVDTLKGASLLKTRGSLILI
jgi:hypothetical protein